MGSSEKDACTNKYMADQLCHGLEENPDTLVCGERAFHGSLSASALDVIDPSAPPNERPTDGGGKSVKGLGGRPYEVPDGVVDPL